jgi:hypothetical protein
VPKSVGKLAQFPNRCNPGKEKVESSRTPLPTVELVDLARATGKWYEIALSPNRFESMCVAYSQPSCHLDGDLVRVRNRCRRTDAGLKSEPICERLCRKSMKVALSRGEGGFHESCCLL